MRYSSSIKHIRIFINIKGLFAIKYYCFVKHKLKACQSVFLDKFISLLILFLYYLGNVNMATQINNLSIYQIPL